MVTAPILVCNQQDDSIDITVFLLYSNSLSFFTQIQRHGGMRSAERMKMNVLEMKCLRNLVGVSRMDRVRNEEVRRKAGLEMELASRADQRVLSWFGHMERMDEYRMARGVLMAEFSGGRVRGRPRLGWMDGVKVALGNRGMTVEAARKTGKSGEPWYICNWMSFTGHFCLALCSFRTPSHAPLIITWRGEGCRYMMWLG